MKPRPDARGFRKRAKHMALMTGGPVKKILADLRTGQNVELYLTVILTVSVVSLDLLNIDVGNSLNQLTLVSLALLAIGNLRLRSQLDALARSVERSHSRLLENYPDQYRSDLRYAHHVRMIGVALNRTLRNNYTMLREKLQSGHVLEVLIINPKSAGMVVAATRYDSSATERSYVEGLPTQASLEILQDLKRYGRVEVRFTDTALTYGAVSVQGGVAHDAIYLEHYAYKGGTDAIPKMVLTAADGRWYSFYRTEMDELWRHATPVELSTVDALRSDASHRESNSDASHRTAARGDASRSETSHGEVSRGASSRDETLLDTSAFGSPAGTRR